MARYNFTRDFKNGKRFRNKYAETTAFICEECGKRYHISKMSPIKPFICINCHPYDELEHMISLINPVKNTITVENVKKI